MLRMLPKTYSTALLALTSRKVTVKCGYGGYRVAQNRICMDSFMYKPLSSTWIIKKTTKKKKKKMKGEKREAF